MTHPFIYISTWKIKEGGLEDIKRTSSELVKLFEENEPQLIASNTYVNEEGTEMTSIQIHPDSASMDLHMQVLGKVFGEVEGMAEAFEFIEAKSFEIYGQPSANLMEADNQYIEAGVPYIIKPIHIAGFTRSGAG